MNSRISPHLHFWATIIAPVALGLAFVLSTGPQVQTYLFSLLNSDVPSVYGSAYREVLNEFPALSTWVSAGFAWQYLLMALSITLVAIKGSEPRLIAWRAALASFLILSTFDIGFGLFQGDLTATWAVANAVGNLLGGIVIAAILIAILSFADFLYLHVPVSNLSRSAIAAGSALLGGLFCCCLVYYITDLFYNPLPVKFETHFAAPAMVAVVAKEISQSLAPKVEDEARQFSLVPPNTIAGNATWTSVEGMLSVKMLTGNEGLKYQVSVTILSGCTTRDEVKKLSAVVPWLVVDDVDDLEVSFDSGSTDFFTMNQKMQASKFKIGTGTVSMFNIDQDSTSKLLKVTQYVDDKAYLEFHSTDEQSFLLLAPVLGSISKKTSLLPRILMLKIGKQIFSFKFDPPRNARRNEKVVCSVRGNIQGQSKAELGFISIGPVDLFAGVLVKVSRKENALLASEEDIGFRVSGGGGFLALGGLQPEQLANHSLGSLQMLQVRGNVTDLVLDDSTATALPLNTYTAVGELQTAYGIEGKLRVSGQAKRLWKDQSRMNPTKWEKLGWEAKLFILGLMGSVAAFLWHFLAQRLRANKRFTWMG